MKAPVCGMQWGVASSIVRVMRVARTFTTLRPGVSAFTRVRSPSKTGVNALTDALCAGVTSQTIRALILQLDITIATRARASYGQCEVTEGPQKGPARHGV